MKLTKKQRDKIGSGYWLFENDTLWDLNLPKLDPLKAFIASAF